MTGRLTRRAPEGAPAPALLLVNAGLGLLLPCLLMLPGRGMPAGLTLFLFLLSALIFLGYRAGRDRGTPLLTWLLPAAFLLRSGLAVLSSFAVLMPALYTLDAQSYDRMAGSVAEAWRAGAAPDPSLFPSLGVQAYGWLCGAVYYLVGDSPLSLKVLNSFAGTLLIYNVYRIAESLDGGRTAGRAALALALFPSLVFWSSQNFREALIFLGISDVIYAGVRWYATGRHRWLLRLLPGLALLLLLRTGTGVVALAALGLVGAGHLARRYLPAAGRVTAGVVLGVGLLTGLYLIKDRAFRMPSLELSPASVSNMRERLAAHGATNFPETRFDSWWDVAWQAPYLTAHYLLAPYPWHLANPVQAMASLENLLVIVCLILGAAGAVRLRRARAPGLGFLLCFVAGLALFGGVIEGNVGTGYRHKMQIIPYFVVLACANRVFSFQFSVFSFRRRATFPRV